MKKLLGLICIVLALVGGYRIARAFSTGEGAPRPTGNAAYDAGRRAGMVAVPVVFSLLGLWLIMHGEVRVFARSDSPSQGGGLTRGITFVVTILATLMVGWIGVLIVRHYVSGPGSRAAPAAGRFPSRTQSDARSRITPPDLPPPGQPPPPGPRGPTGPGAPLARPGEPGTGGVFAPGDKIEAIWAGHWRPGTVREMRGLTLFVGFDDGAMPSAIWIPTNWVRLKR
jgi:hypothetical protein